MKLHFKYIITGLVLFILLTLYVKTCINYMVRTNQMLLCYNAGTDYRCEFVKRGSGW